MKKQIIESVDSKFPFGGMSRQEVSVFAEKHRKDMQDRYHNEILEAIAKTDIITGDNIHYKPYEPRFETMDCDLMFNRSSEVLQRNLEGKTAILNFADYKSPGGLYLEGSVAQEEMLCHDSFLFEVLMAKRFWSFFDFNRENLNKGKYADRMLYVPDVIFYDKYKADVISCAGVNMGWARRNSSANIKDFEGAMILRIFFVILQAYLHGVDNLILGAYGCGVFRNDPVTVARSFQICLNVYFKNCFRKVIFPIPNAKMLEIFDGELH